MEAASFEGGFRLKGENNEIIIHQFIEYFVENRGECNRFSKKKIADDSFSHQQ